MAEVGTGVLVAFKRLKICSFITINDTVILHKDTNEDKCYFWKNISWKLQWYFLIYWGIDSVYGDSSGETMKTAIF